MNKETTIYVDDAGNTGSNLTDERRQYFVLSAVKFSEEELDRIKNDIGYDREMHFFEMKKSIAGRGAIKKFLQHELIDDKHVYYAFTHKRFCIYAKMVDMLIEPVIHYVLRQDLYTQRRNMVLADCLYVFAENHPDKALIEKFRGTFERMMREPQIETAEDFYQVVIQLKGQTASRFSELLEYILMSRQILDVVLTGDKTYSLDVTISSLLVLINYWHKKTGTYLNILTDNSKQIEAHENIINGLMSIPNKQEVGYDSRKQLFPLPITKLTMTDSKDCFGIQVADMVASAVAFRWNPTTDRFQRFQDEIKGFPFFDLRCYSVMPSSVAELTESVDSSNDVDPFEYLAANMCSVDNI